jgi:hypothetical protein
MNAPAPKFMIESLGNPTAHEGLHSAIIHPQSKRDVTAAGRYAAMACEAAWLHFQGSSSSIFVIG